jgi:quercetin 2,3-dioxygenase
VTNTRRAREPCHSEQQKRETWLTFDKADQTDPFAGGFGVIEALDEHVLPPGACFAPRAPGDAEVVTYVLDGALAQRDSTGRSGVVRTGEFQRMSTGRFVLHSQRNASQVDWAHVFQLTISGAEPGLDCTCEQKLFTLAERRGLLCIVASPDGRKGSLRVHQDVMVYSSLLDIGQHLVLSLARGRSAWLHLVRGEATVNGLVLATGDSVGVTDEPAVSFTARMETEILVLDLLLASGPSIRA